MQTKATMRLRTGLLLLLLLLVDLAAAEGIKADWYFSHIQESYTVFVAEEADLRTTGLSTAGLTLTSPSGLYSFLLDGHWINGDDPFSALINDFNGISNIAGDETLRLFHAVLRIGDPESGLSASVGQQLIDDHFLIVDEATLLINSAFGMTAVVTGNTRTPTYPNASPAMHLHYKDQSSGMSTAFGIYDGNSGDQNSNPHGIDFSINNKDGLMFIGEFGWQKNTESTLKIGAWHHSGEFIDYRTMTSSKGNAAIYAIYEGQFDFHNKNFGYFARIARMIKTNKSQILHELVTGLNWYGPLSSQPEDILSLGLVWSHFSSANLDFQKQTGTTFARADEWVLEMTYRHFVNKHISLQPDIQWIVDPHNAERNSFLAGLRITVEF